MESSVLSDEYRTIYKEKYTFPYLKSYFLMLRPLYCKYKAKLGNKDEGDHLYWELNSRTPVRVLAATLKAGFGKRGKTI